MMNDDQLRAKLIEDTGSPAEADRLWPALQQLSAWSAPTPSTEETERLVTTLLRAAAHRPPYSAQWLGWLLRAQARVVQQEIWLASALVMTLGVFVTLTGQTDTSGDMLPLALIAPLVAALGITVLYGPAADPALEIELAMPISPRLIVLTRLWLVFAFDLMLSLLGSVTLVLAQSGWSLWPLVQLWLAPMMFLAALAFLLSMIFSEPLVSVSICLALWGAQVLRVFPPFGLLPNLLTVEARPWLWLIAVLCAGAAIWLAGREERWLMKQA